MIVCDKRSLRGRRFKREGKGSFGKGKGVLGKGVRVSLANSLFLPFQTPATQATTNVTWQRKVKLRVWHKCFKPNSPFTARHIVGHPIPSANVETRPKLTLGTCQKLAGGRGGGGNFIFGFGNEVTHPCNGSEIC